MKIWRSSFTSFGILGLIAGGFVLAHDGDHSAPPPPDALCVTDKVTSGSGAFTYESVPNWCQIPDGKRELGSPTHGGVVVDKAGNIYFTMDGGPHGILVYSRDGKQVRAFADKFVGIHGICLNVENGEEFLYCAHLAGKQAVKMKLDGTVVWTIGVPMESGKYQQRAQYNPTSITVGPNGSVYIADGYGQNWVHEYDQNQKYVRSFGGKGKAPGQFETCHGIALDTRGPKPLLLICDRENKRLQHFDLDGNFVAVVTEGLHRPCSISFHGKNVAIAELQGRVSILDENNKVISVIGDAEDKRATATNKVPPTDWKEGIFNAAHGVSFDKDANLYVEDWNLSGRVSKFVKVGATARAD
ncbi:MAG TPA: hypothetical protein VH370_17620 [Humisphaera sp.]|nr:hypothetical protein [Humisphaera sp.]